MLLAIMKASLGSVSGFEHFLTTARFWLSNFMSFIFSFYLVLIAIEAGGANQRGWWSYLRLPTVAVWSTHRGRKIWPTLQTHFLDTCVCTMIHISLNFIKFQFKNNNWWFRWPMITQFTDAYMCRQTRKSWFRYTSGSNMIGWETFWIQNIYEMVHWIEPRRPFCDRLWQNVACLRINATKIKL